ncbi:Integrase catalytic core [Arabidopsis thaliana x Arabidopsis arenosa]|uniref:Integrase catalytic core n=1 Tax=Arabidopsis thaliana x Arabidopsis arenosa TaxID=1240361 RepID=A0A8T2AZM4_9BRAS|nr:Integrase catalytic core [Arabidopsis thaliana x Arabidopsis arenosa]
MAAPQDNGSDAISLTTTSVLHINMSNVTKLTNQNYMMWALQVHSLLDGYGLAGHLDGTTATPPATVTIAAGDAENPDFKLASIYANPSRGHIKIINNLIDNYTKGTKTLEEYVMGLTTKFDQLANLGKPREHEDQIERILAGLQEEYKPVIDQIEGKDHPPTIAEVHERLLNHEVKLLAAADKLAMTIPASANVAQQRQHNNNNNHRGYNNNKKSHNNNNYDGSSSSYQPSQGYTKQDNRSPRPYLAVGTSYYDPNPWLLDSGATHHMTSDLHNLSLHEPYNGGDDVIVANGSPLPITHIGSKLLPSQTRALNLNKVLCVPDIHKNLISVYRLCNANRVSVEFFPASFQVKDLSTEVPLIHGKTKHGLYEWPATSQQVAALSTLTAPKASLPVWHSRLGHPSFSLLNTMLSTFSLPFSNFSSKQLSCSDCHLNKSHKLPFSQNSIVSTRPLEYLYLDVWTSPILSVDNYKYYLIIIDHFSRYTWLYPLKKKSDVKLVFIAFKALLENKLQQRIGTLFSDNGGEFLALREFLATSGVSHLTSPPHNPEHNGISERKHRHVVESGLTLLSQASIPTTYWTYAFATAVYLINRLITQVLSQQSPFFKLFGTHPDYAKLKVFGCLCFSWLKPYTRHKLESRTVSFLRQNKFTVVGYSRQFACPLANCNSGAVLPSTPMPINGTPSSDLHPSSSSSSSSPSSPLQVSPSNSNSSSFSTQSSEPTAPQNEPQTQAQQTQSPVIKSTTIRLVLDIDVASSWPIKQLDVNNAFLQGELTEDVYMTQPQGFIDKEHPQHVCKLRKPIYGLKQAPRAWYMALKTHLLRTGFSNSLADTSPFIKHTGKSFVYVLVYVDDILVTGNDNSMIAEVLRSFSERFSIKDPTDLTYFLGIEATRTKAGLHLMQRKYIVDLLTKNNMLDAKPVLTPLLVSPKLTLRVGSILKDPSQYRRPRITGMRPNVYSDILQKGVARSSTEAEYRSVANAASEVRWLCSLLTELGIPLRTAPVIYCDNIGATYLCANPVFHSRMKHIALDYHFVRNHIQAGMLRVAHVSTKDQLADALTKPLPRPQFHAACSKIGLTRAPPF